MEQKSDPGFLTDFDLLPSKRNNNAHPYHCYPGPDGDPYQYQHYRSATPTAMGGPMSSMLAVPQKMSPLSRLYEAKSGFHRFQCQRKAGRRPSVAKTENI
jgi:hypothetical protein